MNLLASLMLWNAAFCALGAIAWALQPSNFRPRWFLLALALFSLNILLVLAPLTFSDQLQSLTGLEPFEFNWAGKIIALGATLLILFWGRITAAEAGITLQQSQQAKLGWIVLGGLILLGVIIALLIPNEIHSIEAITYQLTMPSLEEETFHRGLLLAVLFRAFEPSSDGPFRRLPLAAVISAMIFTLIHGLAITSDGLSLSIEALAFAGIFAAILTWLRLRTGSIVAPIILHSAVNTIWRLL